MKKIFLLVILFCTALFSATSQDKKAEKEAQAQAKFAKASAALESKDYVIIVDTYQTENGIENNTDNTVFFSLEKDLAFIQGQIIAGNANTNKLTVSDYNQTVDKKGNIRVSMQLRGFFITGRIEISLRKGTNVADVILTPANKSPFRFTGEIVPRLESKYFKRSGEV